MKISDLEFISCDSDPLTVSEIAQIVSVIGPIPDDYKEFLLKSNGGRLADNVDFEVPTNPSRRSENWGDSIGCSHFAVVDPQFPPPIVTGEFDGRYIRMIEVAGVYQCPIFLMSLDESSFGAIHCWLLDPEKRWAAEDEGTLYIPTEENTAYIAPTFSEFIELADLYVQTRDPIDINTMEHSVKNFARYGDQCLSKAIAFLDQYSVKELNERWPKEARHLTPAISHALGGSQINIVKYLLARGVAFDKHVTRTTHSLELSQLLIEEAGDTLALKQELLRNAAGGISWTSMPEPAENIIIWLTDSGVQPDFSDSEVEKDWIDSLKGFASKKTLRFLESKIEFSPALIEFIHSQLNKRVEGALDSATIQEIMTPPDSYQQ